MLAWEARSRASDAASTSGLARRGGGGVEARQAEVRTWQRRVRQMAAAAAGGWRPGSGKRPLAPAIWPHRAGLPGVLVARTYASFLSIESVLA